MSRIQQSGRRSLRRTKLPIKGGSAPEEEEGEEEEENVKVKFTVEKATKSQKGRSIALLFL